MTIDTKFIDLLSNRKIIDSLPYTFIRFIKKIIGWNKHLINKHQSLLSQINQLQKEDVLVNHKELNQIISSIQNSRNEN